MLHLVEQKKIAEHIKEFFAMKSLNKGFSASLCNVLPIKSLIYFMVNNRVVIPTNGSYHVNLYH